METAIGSIERPCITRLAPSPSGALHLGNACTFLVNWALARARAWRIVLRIEDLDAPRVRPGSEEEIRASLAWLGIDFDGEQPRQSSRGEAYEAAMRSLASRGVVFESRHSRTEVRAAGGFEETSEASAASAPHADGRALRFPPSLRPPPGPGWGYRDRLVNHRMRMPDEPISIVDELSGAHSFALAENPGDPIVWSKAGVASYQLAVVVDDAAAGVTDVVRGDDLLHSAAIQTAISRALGVSSPRWWHLPLVIDDEGRRLSKRDGDLALAAIRARGTEPERVIGLVAHWIGAIDAPRMVAPKELISMCTLKRLRAWSRAARPRLGAEALRWLGR